MATISLCMIVKNEEAVLKRCLDSIFDLMDEIIIVDTGSTDNTKKIASAYTNKIYDFKWIHDFSAARNFSFSKANMDYIYVADADEVVDAKNHEKFKQLKENLPPDTEIVQMLYGNQLSFNTTYNFDEEYRPKLYKRLRQFVWEEAIHEAVRLEPVVLNSDIRIEHRPISNHAGRDFDMFLRLINKGIPLSKKLFNMYARELFIAGTDRDFKEAEDYFEKAAMDVGRSPDEIKEAVCVLSRTARLKSDVSSLLKNASKALAEEAPSEICFELGEYFFGIQDYVEAIIWYYNAAYETTSILNIHCSGDLPLYRLAECYKKIGNKEQSFQYEKLAKEWTL